MAKWLMMAVRRCRCFGRALTLISPHISPKFVLKLLIGISLCIPGLIYFTDFEQDNNASISRNIEQLLIKQLKYDIGTGCKMPFMDPFSNASTWNDRVPTPVICNGTNWVKCYLSKCHVASKILRKYTNISCTYRDIVFETDFSYHLGKPTKLAGNVFYNLRKSDHVNVTCIGFKRKSLLTTTWSGNLAGFRSEVKHITRRRSRRNNINILIFTFDSSARIRFIRRMPKSYKYLTEDLQATVLNKYNIAGDGTKEILTMMLTGKNLYELPTVRPNVKNKATCDVFPFIFYYLKSHGYRTAFLEDGPDLGVYQWDATGFQNLPTDHYATAFNTHNRLFSFYNQGCLGDTPQSKVMMDLTLQFMHLNGKKFIFTLVGDISHNDYNLITNSDGDFVDFLKAFRRNGYEENTLLIVMGDHGPRFGVDRNTPQAQLEERLPLMALLLPEKLKAERPNALRALKMNADSLTSPYDIHATLLDAVGRLKNRNHYTIPGAIYPRGRTLLKSISPDRSCSEAGITPHYCACLVWQSVPQNDPLYKKAGDTFVDYVNFLLEPVRLQCKPRILASIVWVKKLNMYTLKNPHHNYQIKVKLDPGAGIFEATLTYKVNENIFVVNRQDISRTSWYGSEPACIEKTFPHLRYYCYCYR